jgi:hypothetical protein
VATVSETGAVGGKKITIEQFFAIEKQLKEKFEKGEIDRDEFNDSYDRLKCLYEKSENSAEVGSTASSESTKGGSDATKGTRKTNPLENIKYTDKVKAQMKQGDYHSFPESVDAFGADGKVTQITGGDNVVRTKVEIPGSYQGKEGIFEYIIEPDGVTCNHRLFRPNK